MNWFLQHQIETLQNLRYVTGTDIIPPEAKIEQLSSVTFDGVTFNFNRPVKICYSCLGEPAVISDETFIITSITPVSQPIPNTEGSTTITIGNGAMLNPTGSSLNSNQGFDKLIEDNISYELFPETGVTQYFNTAYDSSLNIDPTASGNVIFNKESTGSVVKSVRASNTSTKIIDRYVVLTVLKNIPFEGFFRPPVAGTDKTINNNWRSSRIDYNVFRRINPLNDQISITSALDIVKKFMPNFGLSGKKLQNFDVYPDNSKLISNPLSKLDAISLLHSNINNSSKKELLLRVIQHAIDIYGEYKNGFTGKAFMYYDFGKAIDLFIAAFALQDTELLSVAKQQITSSFNQHKWITSSDIGSFVRYPSDSRYDYLNKDLYINSDLNIPEWTPEPNNSKENNSSLITKYRESFQAGMMEYLNIGLLVNGPSGITGLHALLNNGAYNNSNSLAAPLAYYDRMSKLPSRYLNNDLLATNARRQQWDTRRSLIPAPIWSARPDIIDNTNINVSGGDGVINYDVSSLGFSNDPITQIDARYSLDGIQWVIVQNVNPIGSITGLTKGLTHEISFRFINSKGVSKWTPNYPKYGSSGTNTSRRNRVLVTGNDVVSSVVNTVTPILYHNTFNSNQEHYTQAPVALTTDFMNGKRRVLFAGLGYWKGYPNPILSYQWRADDLDIFGETSNSLNIDSYKFSGKQIDCVISAYGYVPTTPIKTNKTLVPIEIEPAAPTSFNRVINSNVSAIDCYYLTRPIAFENALAGSAGILAFKGRILNDGDVVLAFIGDDIIPSTSDTLRLITEDGYVRFLIRDEVGTVIVNSLSPTRLNKNTGEFTLILSWNLVSTPVLQIYLNGANILNGITLQPGTVPYDKQVSNNFLATRTGTSNTVMELDYIYFNTAEYLDISVAANRDKFNNPATIGAWGKGITGNRPIAFITGQADNYNYASSNKGIGNQLTVKSTSTDQPLFRNK